MKRGITNPSSNNNKFNPISILENSHLAVLLLIIFGSILRLRNLGESLWYDEMLYSTRYWMASWSDLWRLFLFDPPAPFYRVFMFFWTALFGEHELLLRMPSLLFGISSIIVTYWIAETYGSWKTGILAAVLLCLSPVHIWYSQEATPYSMAMFFLLSTVYVFRRLRVDHSHWKWYILYIVFFLLAVFTHYYAAIFLLPLSLLAFSEERLIRKRIIAAHSVVILCLVTLLGIKYISGHLISDMGFLRPFTFFEWWMLFFNWFSHGNSLWTVNPYHAQRIGLHHLAGQHLLLFFQLVFLMILLRGLIPRSEKNCWMQTWELSLFLFSMPLVMLFLTLGGYRHLYIERYLFFILPYFLIVTARGASEFSKTIPGIAIMLFVVIAGIASCGAFFYKSDTWTVYKQNPDWKSASSYLIQEKSPSDELVILSITPADTLEYYLRREGTKPFKVVMLNRIEDLTSILSADNLKTFYLVKNRYWKGNFDKVFQKIKDDRRLQLISSRTFKGLDIYIFANSARGSIIPLPLDFVSCFRQDRIPA